MIKIFAKYGTYEKAVVVCTQDHVEIIQLALAKKYGGSWLLVDKIHAYGEILKFNDGLKYLGFHGRDERYCKGIETL